MGLDWIGWDDGIEIKIGDSETRIKEGVHLIRLLLASLDTITVR